MSQRKNVPASRVREWAASPEGTAALTEAGAKFPGSRGRLDPSTLKEFHKANKRERYETASVAEKPTVTVPVVMLDSAGRKTTRQVTIPTDEARALLDQKGVPGRFNKGNLSDVLSQREADKVAAQFTKAA